MPQTPSYAAVDSPAAELVVAPALVAAPVPIAGPVLVVALVLVAFLGAVLGAAVQLQVAATIPEAS
jgi:hypothetical protein